MKKKHKNQYQQQQPVEKQEKGLSLGDMIDSKLADQLKQLKKEKEAEIQKEKEEELVRKQFEAKQKEKNKTFEELLKESNLDWKKYK